MNKEDYKEFIAELLCNDELEFVYKGVEYGVMHNPPYVYLCRNVIFINGKYESEKYEAYSTIEQLIAEATFDGKKLDEIQQDIEWIYRYAEENQLPKKKKDKRKKSTCSNSEVGEASHSDLNHSEDIKPHRSFFGKVADIFERIFRSRE